MSAPQPGQFLRNGAPPPGWGEPEPQPTLRDTGGHRLAADALALRILEGVRSQFALAGVALPDRQYPSAGAPDGVVWDCEQVTVAATGIGWGPAVDAGTEAALQTGTQMSARALRHIVLEVSIVRKLPAGADLDADDSTSTLTLPDVDAMEAAGRQHLLDMGVLSQAMVTMFGTDPHQVIVPAGTHAQAGLVRSVGPEGGYSGVTSEVTVTLGETA